MHHHSHELNQLISLAAEGNRDAFAELYEQTIDTVYKTVHYLLEDKADLEDVIQEIYLELHKSLNRFDQTRSARAWLMGIVIRQVSAHRRRKWLRIRLLHKSLLHPPSETEPDFSEGVVNQLASQPLLREIERLSFKLKQVLILHYLNQYTQEEIAKILEIPVGTVKSRINAALTKLRQKKGSTREYWGKVESQHEF
ncbi:sigma-70 family RNA polymerase sigma factor [Brevibacillus fulvus]|uniref:RNA polymerase sigma-70 factor (ECF subfamily) n=1 Tax=Brevibacillus fulvus TaxID=1125967 RepID=A0A939BRH4_9BACL|nr:sigma-70 family RNA polymerase sigma factor [Brevibacillus fulvus]MBM7589622.1 RNA polymerase sigma-70 factor (ECF subfamily) [Brevibacillus fulvus]